MIYDLEVTSIRILTMFPYLYSYTESDCWLSYFSCFFPYVHNMCYICVDIYGIIHCNTIS